MCSKGALQTVHPPVLSSCTCALNTLGGLASSPARRKLSASIFKLLLLADLSLQASRIPGVCVIELGEGVTGKPRRWDEGKGSAGLGV